MTNKEFFVKTLKNEKAAFINVIKAVPKDKADWKPHEKARTANNLMLQLAIQWAWASDILNSGVLDFAKHPYPDNMDFEKIPMEAEKNYEKLLKDLASISDKDWEEGNAQMIYQGGKWETKKYDMSWGLLFDAIHHRGQLSTYVRAVGGKVPSIYGGSADSAPPM